MGETAIEWTQRPGTKGETWNPTIGCSRESEGCEHCYAELQAGRIVRMGTGAAVDYAKVVTYNKRGLPVWNRTLLPMPDRLDMPLRAKAPRTYFVNSMSDLFHADVPNEFIAAVFGVMAACPQHTFIILTKRAERMPQWFEWLRNHISGRLATAVSACVHYAQRETEIVGSKVQLDSQSKSWWTWPLPNVWLGVSAENQKWFDIRVPYLLRTPAAVRLVSLEPLLGSINARPFVAKLDCLCCPRCGFRTNRRSATQCPNDDAELVRDVRLDWVIVGGESGKERRACEVAWIDDIAAQAVAADVPVFVKQDSAFKPGQLGRISAATWALKQFPRAA